MYRLFLYHPLASSVTSETGLASAMSKSESASVTTLYVFFAGQSVGRSAVTLAVEQVVVDLASDIQWWLYV